MIYWGNLSDYTQSYAQAGLNHLSSLLTTGFKDLGFFCPHGPIAWQTFPRRFDPLRMEQFGVDRSVMLVHTLITELSNLPVRDGVRTVGLTALDADRCPRWCAVGVNRGLERLIVPSEHSKRAALAGGVTIPVHVAPHTIDRSWWEKPLPATRHKSYVFYYLGTWNARKNPEGVLRAYLQAFPDDQEGARLLLKLTQEDSHRALVQDLVRRITEELTGVELPPTWTRADICVSTGKLPESEIREIHADGDCYVSCTRGEAFGLSVLEAALLGRPVIATNWGGQTEYLSADRGDILCKYKLVPVAGMDSFSQFDSSMQWAEPDVADFAKAMRIMFENRAGHSRQAQTSMLLRRLCSWEEQGPVFRAALGL